MSTKEEAELKKKQMIEEMKRKEQERKKREAWLKEFARNGFVEQVRQEAAQSIQEIDEMAKAAMGRLDILVRALHKLKIIDDAIMKEASEDLIRFKNAVDKFMDGTRLMEERVLEVIQWNSNPEEVRIDPVRFKIQEWLIYTDEIALDRKMELAALLGLKEDGVKVIREFAVKRQEQRRIQEEHKKTQIPSENAGVVASSVGENVDIDVTVSKKQPGPESALK